MGCSYFGILMWHVEFVTIACGRTIWVKYFLLADKVLYCYQHFTTHFKIYYDYGHGNTMKFRFLTIFLQIVNHVLSLQLKDFKNHHTI